MNRRSTGRRVGIKDVARSAGVSVALASLALNDKPGVSEATKSRILAVAETLGYHADPAARALRLGRSDIFGLIVRNLQNPFFLDVISGMQEAALPHGASILVMDADYSGAREFDYVAQLAAHRVAGLAIAPVGPGESVARWRELSPGKPTVVLNAVCSDAAGIMRVAPDNRQAVRLAIEYLASLGHQRIAFLTAPTDVMADHDRLDTYVELCEQLGLKPMPVATPLALDATQQVTAALLDSADPPTAVVTNSDFTVHAVYAAARERGVAVGSQLSVVGHDDLPTSALLDPPLTTLNLDRRALGRAVYARLATDSGLPDHFESVSLTVRSSTGPVMRR
ncbi:MAG: LacI family DNA-binding transcriptional regulator [Stackebrandtia sp.]